MEVKLEELDSEASGFRQRAGATKRGRNHARVVARASELFLRRGLQAVSVAEIARAAEISVSSLYNYFPAPTKARILSELSSETWELLGWQGVQDELAALAPAESGLGALLLPVDRDNHDAIAEQERRLSGVVKARSFKKETVKRQSEVYRTLGNAREALASRRYRPQDPAILEAAVDPLVRSADLAEAAGELHLCLGCLEDLNRVLMELSPVGTEPDPRLADSVPRATALARRIDYPEPAPWTRDAAWRLRIDDRSGAHTLLAELVQRSVSTSTTRRAEWLEAVGWLHLGTERPEAALAIADELLAQEAASPEPRAWMTSTGRQIRALALSRLGRTEAVEALSEVYQESADALIGFELAQVFARSGRLSHAKGVVAQIWQHYDQVGPFDFNFAVLGFSMTQLERLRNDLDNVPDEPISSLLGEADRLATEMEELRTAIRFGAPVKSADLIRLRDAAWDLFHAANHAVELSQSA